MSQHKVLVTGADGFIGSHLVSFLVHQGFSVRALVFYNSFNSWGWLEELESSVLKKVEVVSGDVRDPHAMMDLTDGVDWVFHLAALIAIPFSYESAESYLETNVKGTLHLLQAAKKHGVKRFVHTSTSEVYGTAQYVPMDERHPLNAQSPYAASKVAADQLAMSFYYSFDIPVSIVRPFNNYGPRQSARAVIPTIITQLASGKEELELGALHPTRDFSFVQDIVKGFLLVAQSEKTTGEVINLGSNSEVSIGELAQMIGMIMGKKAPVRKDKKRFRPEKSEVERLCPDIEKAKKLIGWNPEHQGKEGLKRGLEKTINWYTKPENLSKFKHDLYNK